MTLGIDDFVSDLQSALTDLLAALQDDKVTSARERRVRSLGNGLTITTDVTVRVGLLDAADAVRVPGRAQVAHEPLVELIESPTGPRVIVSLPGVRKEDVHMSFGSKRLHLEIQRGPRVFRRTIPCALDPDRMRVDSVTENNSVVEISFSRLKSARRSNKR